MTLESWSNGIVRNLIETEGWWVGAYFVVFIFMTTFTFLNMFVAIFTNTVVALEADSEEGTNTEMRRINQNITELSQQIELLREQLTESE
jgi:cell division protein FtsB